MITIKGEQNRREKLISQLTTDLDNLSYDIIEGIDKGTYNLYYSFNRRIFFTYDPKGLYINDPNTISIYLYKEYRCCEDNKSKKKVIKKLFLDNINKSYNLNKPFYDFLDSNSTPIDFFETEIFIKDSIDCLHNLMYINTMIKEDNNFNSEYIHYENYPGRLCELMITDIDHYKDDIGYVKALIIYNSLNRDDNHSNIKKNIIKNISPDIIKESINELFEKDIVSDDVYNDQSILNKIKLFLPD